MQYTKAHKMHADKPHILRTVYFAKDMKTEEQYSVNDIDIMSNIET